MKVRQKLFAPKRVLILLATFVVGMTSVLFMLQAFAATSGNGMLIYAEGTSTPQKRTWTSGGTSFGAGDNTVSVNNSRYIVTKVSPINNDEMVSAHLSSAGVLDVMRSTNGGVNWSAAGLAIGLGGAGTRRFDIAFEQNSGEIVLAYTKNATNDIGVRRFDGSTWQTEATFDPGTVSTVVTTWIELAEKANSNELAIGYVTNASSDNVGAGIWDGSGNSFGNWTGALGQCDQLSGSPTGADKCMDINYETSSGNPVMNWGITSAGDSADKVRVTRWNGSSWATTTPSIGTGDDATYVDCEANPTSSSNEIACGSWGASLSDTQAWTLNAGTLGVVGLNLDMSAHGATAGRAYVATTYLIDGANQRAVVSWAGVTSGTATTSDNLIDYAVFNGSSWNVTTFSKTMADEENMMAVSNPVNKSEAILLLGDEAQDLFAVKMSLSGTTLTLSNADGGAALEADLGSTATQPFGFAYYPPPPPSQYTQSAYGWFANANSVTPGTALAADNTAYTLTSVSPLRLRMQLSVSVANLAATSQDFSLQYATSTGGPWTAVGVPGGWWNGSWTARRKITFDNSASTENLTNFPVRVSLSSSNIDYARTQNAGQDIRFVDADGTTVLKHEIETWNESGTSEVWVGVPQIDSGSMTDYIWMYYDNASASDGQDVTNVWNSNYKGVWHMKETSGTNIADSTSNAANGTKVSATDPTPATSGKINGAQTFDGSNDAVNMGDITDYSGTAAFSFSAWVNPSSAPPSIGHIFSKYDAGTAGEWWFALDTNRLISFLRACGGGTVSASTIPLSQWSYVTGTYDGTNLRIYINGVLDQTAADSCTVSNTAVDFMVGAGDNGAGTASENNFPGGIDEARTSDIARSGEWIEAEYKSQNLTFNTFASEETLPFIFYDNATPVSGATLSSNLLTGTDVSETYQEANPTASNPNAINNGQQAEWDFSLNPAGAVNSTTYYFRMVKSDGTALNSYTNYPQLIISLPGTGPTLEQKLRGGQSVVNGVKYPFSF